MAFALGNIPIKRKLMVVILLTSGFAILLMGSALIAYELVTFRSALTNNIEVLAQIIGSNSTAALAFDDRQNANEILRALAAENQITAENFRTTGLKFPTNAGLMRDLLLDWFRKKKIIGD